VYGSLDDLLTEMMPPLDSASRVDAALPRLDVMNEMWGQVFGFWSRAVATGQRSSSLGGNRRECQ
jgi:hypothetical protein